MKIGPLDSKPIAPQTADRKAVAAPVKSPDGPSAEVAISATAKAMSTSPPQPAFDSAKVDRIAGAIRDGSYKVDAQAIANKLIINAEELLGHKLG